MTFKNLGLLSTFKTGEECLTCGGDMYQFENPPAYFSNQPACKVCATKRAKERERIKVEEALDDDARKRTYSWLARKSILSDASLVDSTFDSYLTIDAETKANKEKALNIAREYYKGSDHNTFIYGKAGTGKSHLSMAMLKIINENSKPYKRCLFVAVDELMRLIRSTFDGQTRMKEKDYVERLIDADVLVLDDLGSETGSQAGNKQASEFVVRVLYAVMNGRTNKATIITSNLNGADLVKMYDQKLASRILRGAKGNTIEFKTTTDKRISGI